MSDDVFADILFSAARYVGESTFEGLLDGCPKARRRVTQNLPRILAMLRRSNGASSNEDED